MTHLVIHIINFNINEPFMKTWEANLQHWSCVEFPELDDDVDDRDDDDDNKDDDDGCVLSIRKKKHRMNKICSVTSYVPEDLPSSLWGSVQQICAIWIRCAGCVYRTGNEICWVSVHWCIEFYSQLYLLAACCSTASELLVPLKTFLHCSRISAIPGTDTWGSVCRFRESSMVLRMLWSGSPRHLRTQSHHI